MKIVTVAQMQAIEKSADAAGLSYDEMMQNAGKGIAAWVYQNLLIDQGVLGLVGSGNNGGDTIIALTELSKRGVRTLAFLVKQRNDDPLLVTYAEQGGTVVDLSKKENMYILQSALLPGTVILDGILGTGLKLPLRGLLQEVMGVIHNLLENRPGALVIAVDCPSGVDCDTGEVSTVTLPAVDTLFMAAMKQGLLKQPARSLAGDLHYIDIGLDEISHHIMDDLPVMVDEDIVSQHLPARLDSGHKGTFGTCLIVAGSKPFTGAAFLTGKAAYRAGCGLVHIATIRDVYMGLAGQLIEAVWTVLPDINGAYDVTGVDMIEEALAKADSLVVGPGFGLGDNNLSFLEKLLQVIPDDLPSLFDADGLKLLSQLDRWWSLLPAYSVLTPHPGEMAILTGLKIREIQSDRWEIAKSYAKQWNVTLVLKGSVTVIATPTGRLFVNPTSDAALATAGSGDVLSGIIGGLLAQGSPFIETAVSGVWLHAMAGVITRSLMGTDISVTALDLMDNIEAAFIKAQD